MKWLFQQKRATNNENKSQATIITIMMIVVVTGIIITIFINDTDGNFIKKIIMVIKDNKN